jgi:hypothetical protein
MARSVTKNRNLRELRELLPALADTVGRTGRHAHRHAYSCAVTAVRHDPIRPDADPEPGRT